MQEGYNFCQNHLIWHDPTDLANPYSSCQPLPLVYILAVCFMERDAGGYVSDHSPSPILLYLVADASEPVLLRKL